MNINDSLKAYKADNKLTYQNIADKLGVTGQNPRQTIRRWVLGMRTPKKEYLNIEMRYKEPQNKTIPKQNK